MQMVDTLITSSSRLVAGGRRRLRSVHRYRRRSSLIGELGELCYEQSRADCAGDYQSQIDRLVEEISSVERAAVDDSLVHAGLAPLTASGAPPAPEGRTAPIHRLVDPAPSGVGRAMTRSA